MGVSGQRTVLLAGASGLVGGFALRALLAAGRSTVIAPSRRPLAVDSPQLQTVVTNFSGGSGDGLVEILGESRIDAFISCLGTTI